MHVDIYTGDYFHIKVATPLQEEGILKGQYGDLHYKRCEDGLAIYDSSFIGSGFVDAPTSADLGFPSFVNDIPVTEIHQHISISSTYPIAIEAFELKRAYIHVSRKSLEAQMQGEDAFRSLIRFMMRDMEHVNQNEQFTEIDIDFYKPNQAVDYCEIQCSEKCILREIQTVHLKVKAPTVVLKDNGYSLLERAEFTGKVYPFVYSGWDGDEPNIDYFAGIKGLKYVDGSLRGDICWSFRDCISLEKVHLSNGIQAVPSYAFANCSSLEDIYIPDTVTQIGEYAFCDCEKLRTIHLPSNITVIPKGLFRNCKSLTKCYLADSIEIIEDEAFLGCTSLRKPWIPKAIKRIGENAFDN